ncbi:MAG: hypothetical protein FD164_1223 [Nitrospirae bacterium]|nr:MAG: hypothetical protein FD164_1223 [Nitrospirota bacterium]
MRDVREEARKFGEQKFQNDFTGSEGLSDERNQKKQKRDNRHHEKIRERAGKHDSAVAKKIQQALCQNLNGTRQCHSV